MSIEDDIIVKMPTKPEWPAQEQCPHCGLFGIHAMSCQYTQFAATPAPSQPAGAREWKRQEPCPECDGDGCAACLADVDEWFRINRPKLHDAVKYAAGEKGKAFDIIVFEACAAFAAQQTAAKDTEIERLTRKLESAGNAAKRERDRAEAAERERDSLRDENAALKAGKDGQQ